MDLRSLTEYLDTWLRVREVPDYPNALNGLQVESGRAEVRRIAVAVDAVQHTVDAAVRAGADLLLVHHGLFWDGNQPVTGRRYRRLKALLDADLAVYSAHLPLDVHPEVGNNAILVRELGIEARGSFGEYKGLPIGVWGELETTRGELAERAARVLGGPVHAQVYFRDYLTRFAPYDGRRRSRGGAGRAGGRGGSGCPRARRRRSGGRADGARRWCRCPAHRPPSPAPTR